MAAAVKELACRSEGVDLITGRFDQPRQCSPNGGIVIDDKDRRRNACGFFGFDSQVPRFSSVSEDDRVQRFRYRSSNVLYNVTKR